MANYKELYFQLYNDITNMIEQLKLLQIKAEENYLSQEEPRIVEITGQKRHASHPKSINHD